METKISGEGNPLGVFIACGCTQVPELPPCEHQQMARTVALAERGRCITELEKRGHADAVAVLMEPLLPSLPQLQAWMRAHGWRAAPPELAGSMWFLPGAVPGSAGDQAELASVIRRLARAHGRSVAGVLAEILDGESPVLEQGETG